MWNEFSKPSGRRGLTLVEVIAGLVLLATLLTSVLAAFKTHAVQIRGARDRLQASEAADELLSGWLAQGALPPVGTQKALAGADGWAWRVMANESQQSGPVRIGSLRVEIVRPRAPADDEVLASVALVVPGNTGVVQ
jgi:prepilin-type N-terminal cleavage/methylation domain-containing protein